MLVNSFHMVQLKDIYVNRGQIRVRRLWSSTINDTRVKIITKEYQKHLNTYLTINRWLCIFY